MSKLYEHEMSKTIQTYRYRFDTIINNMINEMFYVLQRDCP